MAKVECVTSVRCYGKYEKPGMLHTWTPNKFQIRFMTLYFVFHVSLLLKQIKDTRFGDVYYHTKWLRPSSMENHIKLLDVCETMLTFNIKYFNYNCLRVTLFALHFGELGYRTALAFWVKFNYKGCAGTRSSLENNYTLACY